jgi:hypothetical protein
MLIKASRCALCFAVIITILFPEGVNAQQGVYSTAVVNFDSEGAYTPQEYLAYQLQVSTRVLDDISEIFTSFSEAEIEAGKAMDRIDLIAHEYEKALKDVTPEGEALHGLMRALLSHTENYLAYFKRFNREDPDINSRIVQIKREVNQEMVRLHYLAD